jgi:hypothetical protein
MSERSERISKHSARRLVHPRASGTTQPQARASGTTQVHRRASGTTQPQLLGEEVA